MAALPSSTTHTATPPRPAPVVAIVGPTASGKSSLALDVARASKAALLCCDSLTVYQELDVGSAKPTAAERREILHEGLDWIRPDQNLSAPDFAKRAKPWVEEQIRKGTPVLIVGGTGFYLKALLMGIWPTPPGNPESRARWEDLAAKTHPHDVLKQNQFLHEKLIYMDSIYANKIAFQDRYRVLRALEIIETIGQPLSRFLKSNPPVGALSLPESAPSHSPKVPVFGLRWTTDDLGRRIEVRTQELLHAGFVQEVEQLVRTYGPSIRALQSVGYREILQALLALQNDPLSQGGSHLSSRLQGDPPLQENLTQQINLATRQLAKRQKTFFNGFFREYQEAGGWARWFDYPQEQDQLRRILQETLQT